MAPARAEGAGARAAAADALDLGRSLDLADRYLNTKATKYALRAGRTDAAEATIALFVKHDAKEPGGDPLGNLREMQVSEPVGSLITSRVNNAHD